MSNRHPVFINVNLFTAFINLKVIIKTLFYTISVFISKFSRNLYIFLSKPTNFNRLCMFITKIKNKNKN